MTSQDAERVGIIGTGFVARHLAVELKRRCRWRLGPVLTRRRLDRPIDFAASEALTDSLTALIEGSEVIVECTGDVAWAAQTIDKALAAGRPVLTLNPEFHVTLGSAFVGRGWLSEAEGDQPGSTAALYEEAVTMGFAPLVLGNMKGFLNRTPSRDDMLYWAERQGLSLDMVTAFTDGTKLQIEQCLVGNYFAAEIATEEMIGPVEDDLDSAARLLGERAQALGCPITDYVLSRRLPHGVFVVARHHDEQQAALRYLKMGEGPFYTLVRPNILVHLEALKTLERWARGGPPLLDNGRRPHLSVAAVAKRQLLPGSKIVRGYGSFDLRGICVRIAERPDHLPITLAVNLEIRRKIAPGEILTFEDVALPDSPALDLWQTLRRNPPQHSGRRRFEAA